MIKKISFLAMAFLMLFGLSTTVCAAEFNNNVNLFAPSGLTEMQLGETRKIGEIDGQPLEITLVKIENSNPNLKGMAPIFSAYNYEIRYAGAPAINISLLASFMDFGMNSYMLGLVATHSISNNTFSASWDSSQDETNGTFCRKVLKIRHFSGDSSYRFEAWIKPTSPAGVTFYVN